VLYHCRYNSTTLNGPRPFKVVTIDVNVEPTTSFQRYPHLAKYIKFFQGSSTLDGAHRVANDTFNRVKPKNVFVSLDGSHTSEDVYEEMKFYQQFLSIGNYLLVQDTRLSRKWHREYCARSAFDGPCNGPLEAVNHFMKNEGKGKFVIDKTREYMFSTHMNGWLRRIV